MEKPNNPKVLSLRTRTLMFLVFLSFIALGSLTLLVGFQDRFALTSRDIREQLLPTSSLVEKVYGELGHQVRELGTFVKENPSTPVPSALSRLSPAARSLLSLHTAKQLPKSLDPLMDPWTGAIENYQNFLESPTARAQDLQKSLALVYQRTEFLKHAVDREFSIQLLILAGESQNFLELWTAVFLVNTFLMFLFLYMLHRWTTPLHKLSHWIEQGATSTIPRPLQGSGPFSAPFEVQKLHNALRAYVLKVREQEDTLESRRKSTAETEKAMGTLFSVLGHVMKHNEELLQQLLHKERLASMGEMAAELAHEIRNPLNSMNLKLELMRDELSPEQQNILDRVLAEIDRLDALTESHLRNTKATLHATFENTELVKTLQNILVDMKEDFAHKSVELETEYPTANEHILSPLPESVLKAVMINLLKNACESFSDDLQMNRRIKLRLDASPNDASSFVLSIMDTGCGFPPEMQNKPFTSFKTTKHSGSGLGLATSHKMLTAWGLELQILNPPPVGYATCLQIHFAKRPTLSEDSASL